MSRLLTIATCQHPVGADVNGNFKAVRKQILFAGSKQADIIFQSWYEGNLSKEKYQQEGIDQGELRRNRSSVLISTIDFDKKFIDPSAHLRDGLITKGIL